MKKLLVSVRVSVFPPEHGGAKNIRQIVKRLTEQGVECRVLVKMHPPSPVRHRFAGQHPDGLVASAGQFESWNPQTLRFVHEGVSYQGISGSSDDLARASERLITEFQPDGFLLCDDSLDDGSSLFEVGAKSERLLFLAQTIHCQPFGPYAMKPSQEISNSIRRAKRIIAPSQYVKNYIETHLGKTAEVYYPNVFGAPPFAKIGSLQNRFVTMVNPCPWKGSSIFIKLATLRPDLEFAAVPTWGATGPLLDQLRKLPNVTLLEESSDIDDIFRKTRVLLAPSLCQEAFGLVSPEALLRGIPVIASDIAGLRESTLGVTPLIPVKPLPFDNAPRGDDHTKFVWAEPDNPVEPWNDALQTILSSKSVYEQFSLSGKIAAEAFVKKLSTVSALEVFS